MRIYQSRFHPTLDDPGPWDVWQLSPGELAGLQALLKDAGIQAAHALLEQYGSQATLFDAPGLVRRLAGQPLDDDALPADALFHTALTLLAYDCYQARVPVPRPAAGGSTNPANRRHGATLRAWLLGRLQAWLQADAQGSLVARAIYARIPQDGLPTGQIARRLRKQVEDSRLFVNAEVNFELRPKIIGGPRWLQAETVHSLREMERKLHHGEPVLVELIRDAEASPATAQVVVVYRLEDAGDGWIGLWCYDPGQGTEPLALRLRSAPGHLIVYDATLVRERPAVKGIRLVAIGGTTPPRFGARRYTRWLFPWAVLWHLRRRWRPNRPAR
ncbi:MAG: hypothetical protein HUJ28_04130 [Chromatiales bacterium]|nr:hypothetical protein [Chromatiales bacterium]